MRAPMTGALFAAELTNHLSALPETIAAGSAAYAVSVLVMKRSILTEKIARRGRHISARIYGRRAGVPAGRAADDPRPGDACPATWSWTPWCDFSRMRPSTVPTPWLTSTGGFSVSSRAPTPSLEGRRGKDEGQLAGTLSDASTEFAFPETPCGEVADMMVESGVGRVPIVDHQDRRVVGIISRQDLLKVRSRQKSGESRKVPA